MIGRREYRGYGMAYRPSWTGSLGDPMYYRDGNTSDITGLAESVSNQYPECKQHFDAYMAAVGTAYDIANQRKFNTDEVTYRDFNTIEQSLQDAGQYVVGIVDCLTHYMLFDGTVME